ncbi:MAG: hypothetical protein ABEJ22_06630 [Haloferacaceae archaeon]
MTQATDRSNRLVDLTLVPVVLLATLMLFVGLLPLHSGAFWALVIPAFALLVVATLFAVRASRRLPPTVEIVAESTD